MKILITGGAGYVGTELTHVLSTREDVSEIVVYDNLSRDNYNLFLKQKFPKGKVRFVNADILNTRKLQKELEGIDVVYHLAAKVSTPFAGQESHVFEQTNRWGTAEVSYVLEESDVHTVVYLSSAAIYGHTEELITEETTPSPKTFYAITKLGGEPYISRLKNKMKAFVIRGGNVFGYSASMRFEAVINKFMWNAHFNNLVKIHGSGEQIRSFIHVQKMINGLSDLLDSNIESGTYNLVGTNFSILDIADKVKELYPRLEMIFVDQHMGMRDLKVEPNSKIKQYLELRSTPIMADLKEMKEHFSF